MIEVFFLIAACVGLGERAQQRGLDRSVYVAAAAVGWSAILVLSFLALGPLGLLLRWAWVGGVYFFIENAHGSAKVSQVSWLCPECRLFNDGGTLICLCGYRHPQTPPGVGDPEDSAEGTNHT